MDADKIAERTLVIKINMSDWLSRLALKTVKSRVDESDLLVIDWSASGSLLLHLDMSAGPKILRYAKISFDDATTENEKHHAYQQFLQKISSGKKPMAVITWSDTAFRQLSFPEMPKEDLIKAVHWDLKKKYYFNPDENLMGYQPVMMVEGAEGQEKLYNLFYCENKTALPRLSFFSTLNIEAEALIPSQAALAKFTQFMKFPADKDLIVCELSEGSIKIIVVRSGLAMLARNVSMSVPDGHWTDTWLSKAADEVHRTIDYYEAQRNAKPVGAVLFTGSGVSPTKLLDFMIPKFNVPVTLPSLDAFLIPGMEESEKQFIIDHPGLFAVAVGASSMQHEIDMNLLPDEIKSKNQHRSLNRLLNLGLIVFAVLLLTAVGASSLNIQWMRTRIATLEKKYAEVSSRKDMFKSMISESRIRRVARKGDIPVRSLLKELSLKTPSLIVLTELQYIRQEGTLSIAGQIAEDKRDSSKVIAQFVTTLGESIFLESANLTSTTPDEAAAVLRFQIDCKVKGLS